MPTERHDDFVNLCECDDVIGARGLEAALRGSGISCVIKGLSHREQLGMLGPHISLNVLVKREDFAVARAIVANYGSAPTLHEEDLPDELRPDPDDTPDDPAALALAERRAEGPDERRARDRTGLFCSVVVGLGTGYFYRGHTALGLLFGVWQLLALRHLTTTEDWSAALLLAVVRVLDPVVLWWTLRSGAPGRVAAGAPGPRDDAEGAQGRP